MNSNLLNMDFEKIKFSASSCHALLTGGNELTEKQQETLAAYSLREQGVGRALTANQEAELNKLKAKASAPFEFGATAMSLIELQWLRHKFGYKKLAETPATLKGHICEQDSMELLDQVLPVSELRVKNTKRFEDSDYFIGTPDIILEQEEIVEDVKTPINIENFLRVKNLDPVYFTQGQVYMDITGFRKFRVCYCLVTTPELILQRLEDRVWRWYSGGPMADEAVEQIRVNHTYDHIPKEERVKVFEFEYDPEYISKLQNRVELAREVMKKMSLNKVPNVSQSLVTL